MSSKRSKNLSIRVNKSVSEPKLDSDNFNAAEYVNAFLKETRSGEEVRKLQTLRSQLNSTSNAASEQIKDIVFDNYKQFIDTSKQISSLEREIYELSSLLTDQKGMLEKIMEMCGQDKRSSCSTSLHSVGGNTQASPVQSLIHQVEGIADVLNNLKSNESLLLVSKMSLLDENTMEIVAPILLILLSETLIIAKPSDGDGRLRFQHASTHRLDKVALVNVKRAPTERPYAELIIQLIIFPQQLYIKCESARVKRQWLDGIETAKRALEQEKSLQRQATIRAKRRKSSTTPHPNDPRARLKKHAASSSASPSESTIYEDEAAQTTITSKASSGSIAAGAAAATAGSSSTPPTNEDEDEDESAEEVQWLQGLANDLQDVIAHRHMDEAVEMLLEWKQCACTNAKLNAEFAEIERCIVRMLSDDVRRPGALHGGARALSQPLHLLKRLDRSTYATNLYLSQRTSALSARARELAISEDSLAYVKEVAKLFIGEVSEALGATIGDVLREFDAQIGEYALVQTWCCGELSLLLKLIRRHVVEVAPTIMVLARTWSILLDECDALIDAGLDLSFEIHRLLAPALREALEKNFANILESIRLRVRDESWQPYCLETEAQLNRYLEEMSDLGFNIESAISSQPAQSLNLAQSGCYFSRIAVALSRDLSLLKTSGLASMTDAFITTLWRTYGRFLDAANVMQPTQTRIHALTCEFLVNAVVERSEAVYRDDSDEGIVRALIYAEFPRLARYKRESRSPPLNDAAAQSDSDEEVANV